MQAVRSRGSAIVTGAAQGLGRAIALRLAADGYNIVLNDHVTRTNEAHSLAKEIEKQSRSPLVVSGDISEESTVVRILGQATSEFKSVDVMVANAGIIRMGAVQDIRVEELDRMLAVNIRGVALCIKHAARMMIAQGNGGRILAATSIYGRTGREHIAGYSATKFAIRGLVQSAASDLGQYGITVNAYAPGPIKTPAMEVAAGTLGVPVDALIDASRAQSSLRKTATPEDIAGVVSFLASPDAQNITGQTFTVDGGLVFD